MGPPHHVFALLAAGLAVVALGLVCAWAQYNPYTQEQWGAYGYLNLPSWETNVFAWHPVLMVAGFFMAQVFSLTSIAWFGEKQQAFLSYFFWQCAALGAMITALRAIVKYKYDSKEYSLITMHSWIGVLAVIFFVFNYLYGNVLGFCGMGGMKFQSSATYTHMALSLITLALTFISIVSGINVYFGEHGCDYLKHNPDRTALNAGFYYYRLPWACKLSNGLGLAVLFASVFTTMALAATRSRSLFQDDSEDAAEEGAKDEAEVVDIEMTEQ